MSYVARDERMGPWRPIPKPRRAIWRYRLASAVAVLKDSLEVAGVFPLKRYFWAPFLETPEEITEWKAFEARGIAFRARVKAPGPSPDANSILKAAYADIEWLLPGTSALERLLPTRVARIGATMPGHSVKMRMP